jgi:hypothetical protein
MLAGMSCIMIVKNYLLKVDIYVSILLMNQVNLCHTLVLFGLTLFWSSFKQIKYFIHCNESYMVNSCILSLRSINFWYTIGLNHLVSILGL